MTARNRDEVAVDAVGRRLAVEVVFPARNVTVASKRERVPAPRSNHSGREPRGINSLTFFGEASLTLPRYEGESERFVR